MHELTGNLTGLKPSETKALERVYRRRIAPARWCRPSWPATCAASRARLERQVGVLASRRGEIEHVFVGDASRIYAARVRPPARRPGPLPGPAPGAHPPAQRGPDPGRPGRPGAAAAGPGGGGGGHPGWPPRGPAPGPPAPATANGVPWTVLPAVPFHQAEVDAADLVAALEEEFERAVPTTVATAGRGTGAAGGGQHPRQAGPAATSRASMESRVAELRELCRTAGIAVGDVVEQRRPEPDPKYLVGPRQAGGRAGAGHAGRRRGC